MARLPDPDSQNAICTSCGLCCDGSLFDYAALEPGEDWPAPTAPSQEADDGTSPRVFPLPCRMLEGSKCGIYCDRPAACRAYTCRLLENYQTGTLTEEQCLQRINSARESRAEIAAAMEVQGSRRDRLLAVQRELQRLRDGKIRPSLAVVQIVALERHLDRHFRAPGQTRTLRSED